MIWMVRNEDGGVVKYICEHGVSHGLEDDHGGCDGCCRSADSPGFVESCEVGKQEKKVGAIYPIDESKMDDLAKRFTYHPPKGDQAVRYEEIRSQASRLAVLICSLAPVSREQSLALTHLEDAVMWTNAAIARNE